MKTPWALFAGSFVASLAFAAPVRAEPIGPLVHEGERGPVADREAYATVGLDGALASTIGAAFGIAPAGARLGLATSADVTWVVGNLDVDDVRVRAGMRADVLRAGRFRVRVMLAPSLRMISTEAFVSRSFGTEARVAPGFDVGRWSFEADAMVEQSWIAYVAPTDSYRQLVYAGAVSGWYGLPARTLRLGASGGARIGRFDVYLEGGWERTASLDILPAVYGTLGVGARF